MEPARKRSLQDIVTELLESIWQIDDAEGELSPELEADLDSLEEAFSDKVDKCLLVRQDMMAKADALKARSRVLSTHAKRLSKNADWLKDYIHSNMLRLKLKKISTENFPLVSVARTQTAVVIFDEDAFIKAYGDDPALVKTKIEKKPIKATIKDKLESGASLEGATLDTDRTHLRVS
jgi:hypothetical protein